MVQKPRAEEAEFRHLSLLEPSGFSASSASTPMSRASGEILSGNLAMNRSARHPAVEIDTGVTPRRSPTITAMAEFDIQPVQGPVHHAAPNPDSSPRVDSGQQFLDHLGSSHLRVGQTLWPPRVHKCQPGMIDAQLIEYRGVQIGDTHSIHDRAISKLIGFAVDVARPKAPPRQQQTEGVSVVIPPIAPLRYGKSSELTRPEDDHILKQATLLEIENQCRTWLIDPATDALEPGLQVGVSVPRLK